MEDVAINLGHIYVYTTSKGWEHTGPASPGLGDAIRVLIDRAGQVAPTPDHPIADAMLQVMVPTSEGVKRKGIRINFMMPPASPYGDTITLRVSNYRLGEEAKGGSLGLLCKSRLPAVSRPEFKPIEFPRGEGVLTSEGSQLSPVDHGKWRDVDHRRGDRLGQDLHCKPGAAGDAGFFSQGADPPVSH